MSLTLFINCASKRFAEPTESGDTAKAVKKIYSQSFTDIWNSTLKVLESRSYVLAEIRKDRGQIVTDWVSGKSDRLFSGYGETRIPYSIRHRLILDIQPTKNGTKVVITNKEQYYTDSITGGFDFQGSLYQWLDTASSGNKESIVLQDLDRSLNAKT